MGFPAHLEGSWGTRKCTTHELDFLDCFSRKSRTLPTRFWAVDIFFFTKSVEGVRGFRGLRGGAGVNQGTEVWDWACLLTWAEVWSCTGESSTTVTTATFPRAICHLGQSYALQWSMMFAPTNMDLLTCETKISLVGKNKQYITL